MHLISKFSTMAAVVGALLLNTTVEAVVIPVHEDVMTSSFFTGTDLVRGYAGDSRPTFRVSTDGAFGLSGAETIYLTFDSSQFSGLSAPVSSAILTVQSKDGGFGANASAGSPFTVSAHAVTSNPLTTILDNTNPSGTKSWLDFYNDDILAAAPAALTAVDSFGPVTFDVTAVVNDWLSGANTVFALALTGKNDTSGSDFLHGFQNNSEALGSTFLTVTTVPEPSTLVVGLLAMSVSLMGRRRLA